MRICWLMVMIFVLLPALTSCSGVDVTQFRLPYMMPVQQGTYITAAQYNSIFIGESKQDVRFILGAPLSYFTFSKQRWDFFYQQYVDNKMVINYDVTIWFDNNNRVLRITHTGSNLFSK
jgi:outer membrane protein assembly factor BamE (lipoprotein component of BamABCDE complex)